jgi:hypothetical protein
MRHPNPYLPSFFAQSGPIYHIRPSCKSATGGPSSTLSEQVRLPSVNGAAVISDLRLRITRIYKLDAGCSLNIVWFHASLCGSGTVANGLWRGLTYFFITFNEILAIEIALLNPDGQTSYSNQSMSFLVKT